MKKRSFSIISSIIFGLTVSACGGSPVIQQAPYYVTSNTVDDCCCCCEDDGTTNTNNSTKEDTTDNSKDNSTTDNKVNTDTKEDSNTKSEDKTTNTDSTSKGRQILDKALQVISTPNAFTSVVDKYERSLADGREVYQTIKLTAQKPGKVLVDVIKHTKSSSVGARMFYTSGGSKATVRPGGALSFITKDFPMTAEEIITPNNYKPDQIDFFYMSKRLSQSKYEAELSGKTTIDGSNVFLLKVTTKGTNDLDPKITHEIIGFDSTTFDVKLWEAYAGENSQAFLRMNIKSFTPASSFPDSTFKV